MSAQRAALAVAALLLLQLGLGLSFIRSAAPTYDETVHLASGYTDLVTGRLRLNIMDHPPLAEMWAALPLLVVGPNVFFSHPDWLEGRVYNYADVFLYRNKMAGGRMVNIARVFCLLTWSVLLAWGLWGWATRLGGPAAAPWVIGAAGLMPVLVSNLSLVTTDAASAVFFFLFFRLLSQEPRTPRRAAAAGVCAGLALASKFNMVLLLPLAAGALLLERVVGPRSKPVAIWGPVGAAALGAILTLAVVYRFGDLPLYYDGLLATMHRLGQGRSSFLMGRYSTTGFWLYFPVALAIKTPLPILALSLGMAAAGLRRPASRREWLWVVVPALGYFLASLSAKTQIGVRHLLPVMPFIALAAGCGAAELWARGEAWRISAGLLSVWLAASVLRATPDLLAYFNEAVGGPARGYRYLVDSNLDWGQGLKELGKALHEMGDPPIYLSYFGTADPAEYGIRYFPVAFSNNVDRLMRPGTVQPEVSGRVLLAVSATNLQCTYFADKTLFDWLKARTPLKIVGHSIFLYDLTADKEGRRRLADLVRLSGFPGRVPDLLIK